MFFLFKDVEPETVPTKHKEILRIITYVGCSLSVFGLTLTLFTMFIFKYVTTEGKCRFIWWWSCTLTVLVVIVVVIIAVVAVTAVVVDSAVVVFGVVVAIGVDVVNAVVCCHWRSRFH